VVVRPDQLIQEALAAEQRVEQHLRVVRLTVIQVQVQGAVIGEQAPRLGQPRLQKRPVVVELVVVAQKLTQDSLVPLTLETRYRSRLAAHTRRRLPRLRTARVEGRVEVGEGERGIREPARDLEVVAL